MPLFPKLVGGITVRERPSRYEGEPKYRRLDFVRNKATHDEEADWPIINHPVRGIQLYNAAYHNPYYASQAAQYAAAHGYRQPGIAGRFPPAHPVHRVPARPLSDGTKPRAIEARPEILEGLDSEDEELAFKAILKEHEKDKKKGKKAKKNQEAFYSGHSIFESSDSDSDYVPIKKKKNKHTNR